MHIWEAEEQRWSSEPRHKDKSLEWGEPGCACRTCCRRAGGDRPGRCEGWPGMQREAGQHGATHGMEKSARMTGQPGGGGLESRLSTQGPHFTCTCLLSLPLESTLREAATSCLRSIFQHIEALLMYK